MSNQPRIVVLDASNSLVYVTRPGGVPKVAHIRWEAARYELSWGSQNFDGPHVVVHDPKAHYGVEMRTFFKTHKPVVDRPHHYLKSEPVRAMQVTERLTLVTVVSGRKEMIAEVPEGAFIVQNPDGEQYAISAEEFALLYVPGD